MSKLYVSLISFFMCYSFIAYCHNTVDTALFSEGINNAVEKYDPIAFKQALDKFGSLNKHARVLLKNSLAGHLGTVIGDSIEDEMSKIEEIHVKRNFLPAVLTILGGMFAFSNGLDWWRDRNLNANEPTSFAKPSRGTLYFTIFSAALALYGLCRLIQEGRRVRKERKQIEQAAAAELKSKNDVILNMIKIVSEHPGEDGILQA